MIFILLYTAVIATGIFLLIQYILNDDGFFGVLVLVLTWVFGTLIVSVCLMGLSYLIPPSSEYDAHTDLRAIGTDSSTGGSFFLGTGTIKDEQVFEYITEDEHGGNRVESVETKDAIVYEDAEPDAAYLNEHYRMLDYWWWFPGKLSLGSGDYQFHVPSGSIDQNYTISVSD